MKLPDQKVINIEAYHHEINQNGELEIYGERGDQKSRYRIVVKFSAHPEHFYSTLGANCVKFLKGRISKINSQLNRIKEA